MHTVSLISLGYSIEALSDVDQGLMEAASYILGAWLGLLQNW